MSNCYGLLMGIQSCIIYHLLHSLSKIVQVFPNVLTYYSIILLFARGMSSPTPKMSLVDGFAHLYIVKLHKSHILSHYGNNVANPDYPRSKAYIQHMCSKKSYRASIIIQRSRLLLSRQYHAPTPPPPPTISCWGGASYSSVAGYVI